MAGTVRHATALHGDVAGYSRLTADNEIETHNTLQAFRRIIEEELASQDGELVQFVGDEFLAIVPTELGAITAAVAVQRRIAEANATLPAGRRTWFRLGINSGEITFADGQWYGDAINIAARLQALADPGGINVSRGVLDAADDVPFSIEPMGRKRLKNIPEPVGVFKLIDDEATANRTKPWRRRIPIPKRPSLAVSPFVNLGDAEDSHFADGLMMGLVIALMRIPGLDLVSDTSTLGYRDQPFSAQQIGHELGVRYVLEGAVQRSGDRVRVMTQLLDVEESTTAWADRFEATFDDVFAAQDDIVHEIVKALDIEVIGGEPARMYRSHLDPSSVEIGYRGLQHMTNGTPEDLTQAIAAFEQVIEREPESASGYMLAALAHLWTALFIPGADEDAHYAAAERFANEAVERNDESGIGHTVLSHVLVYQHDWEGALEHTRLATAQRPSCDLSYGVAASVMRYLGETEDAVEYANRAIRLSPLFSNWYESILANSHYLAGNYDEAAEIAEGVVADDDAQLDALLTLAAAQSTLGRERHARAALDHAKSTRPGLNVEALRHRLPYRDEKALARFIEALESSGLD
jgi:adenylate cyclase